MKAYDFIAIGISLVSAIIAFLSYLAARKANKHSERANLITELDTQKALYEHYVQRYRGEFTKYENNKNLGDSFAEACRNAASDYQQQYQKAEREVIRLREQLANS